jgi:hypothetical protein
MRKKTSWKPLTGKIGIIIWSTPDSFKKTTRIELARRLR